jgi:hypothetical protein
MAVDHNTRVILNKMYQERERRALEKQQEKISHRYEANKELIQNLSAYVELYPELRFGQILEGFGFVVQDSDLFNEESVDTLERVRRVSYDNNDN